MMGKIQDGSDAAAEEITAEKANMRADIGWVTYGKAYTNERSCQKKSLYFSHVFHSSIYYFVDGIRTSVEKDFLYKLLLSFFAVCSLFELRLDGFHGISASKSIVLRLYKG